VEGYYCCCYVTLGAGTLFCVPDDAAVTAGLEYLFSCGATTIPLAMI